MKGWSAQGMGVESYAEAGQRDYTTRLITALDEQMDDRRWLFEDDDLRVSMASGYMYALGEVYRHWVEKGPEDRQQARFEFLQAFNAMSLMDEALSELNSFSGATLYNLEALYREWVIFERRKNPYAQTLLEEFVQDPPEGTDAQVLQDLKGILATQRFSLFEVRRYPSTPQRGRKGGKKHAQAAVASGWPDACCRLRDLYTQEKLFVPLRYADKLRSCYAAVRVAKVRGEWKPIGILAHSLEQQVVMWLGSDEIEPYLNQDAIHQMNHQVDFVEMGRQAVIVERFTLSCDELARDLHDDEAQGNWSGPYAGEDSKEYIDDVFGPGVWERVYGWTA